MKYTVTQFNVGDTNVEADYFEISDSFLNFYVNVNNGLDVRRVAAFRDWTSVVEVQQQEGRVFPVVNLK